MIRKLLVVFLVALSAILPAIAGCGGVACNNVVVTRIMAISTGDIFVFTDGDESGLNCTLASGDRVIIEYNSPGADRMLALLMTVKASGEPISLIRIVDGSSVCAVSYIQQNY